MSPTLQKLEEALAALSTIEHAEGADAGKLREIARRALDRLKPYRRRPGEDRRVPVTAKVQP